MSGNCKDCRYRQHHVDGYGAAWNECAADGWSGELCHPSHESCDMLHPKVNEWERQFMCEEHAAEHVKFCEEAIAG